ncbi:MAG: amidohydrolase family protein [Bacteroidia bacterium]|nr:amidohydrolase family protein [Bacteroidia bacterium]
MRIDSHQHFWKYNPKRHRWITEEMSVIQRDFLPNDLTPILQQNRIDGCVSVQADQTEDETRFLLKLAEQDQDIKGVVGWVDLKSEKIIDQLRYYTQFPKLKGFRHVVQDEADGFLSQKEFLTGIKALRNFNYSYDILVYARQLEEVIWFVNKFPDQKFVVDHLAKPSIKEQEFKSWAKNISMVAAFENVSCKLSGMVTEANWNSWTPDDFKSYLDFALETFGANRLMYGSDWPVCLVAASYKQQLSLVEDYIAKLSATERESIMGGNATSFYNL